MKAASGILVGSILMFIGTLILMVSNAYDNIWSNILNLAVSIALFFLYLRLRKKEASQVKVERKRVDMLANSNKLRFPQVSTTIGTIITIGVLSIAFEWYISIPLIIAIGFFVAPILLKQTNLHKSDSNEDSDIMKTDEMDANDDLL